MHLRLIKGLSYDGVVRASAAHPDVFVDDPEKYTALLESGYFEALPDAHTVTGHLDADFLGEMDEEQLDKLADDMGVDTTGKDTAEVVAAVLAETHTAPEAALMVGDRKYDVTGAAACGVPCLGVYYGYAEPGELEAAGAVATVQTVAELSERLLHWNEI